MSSFKVIENNEKSRKNFGYNYGYDVYSMTKEDVEALLNGKQLATTINCDEYSIFIELKEGDENANSI